jgi:hypothetical protein
VWSGILLPVQYRIMLEANVTSQSFAEEFGGLDISGEIGIEYHGAVVTVKAGAQVSDVKLLSSIPCVQIMGLP